jgi:hypothetical protein
VRSVRVRPIMLVPGTHAPPWRVWLLTAAALAAVTVWMFHGALRNGWRFDDGAHMLTATRFEPWEYFFLPSITNRQSMAGHVTPWNAFFYDVNLRLFGFSTAGYYAHQMAVLWLTSIASVALLRRWTGLILAVFGAILFLIGAPTSHVANSLMTGHYAAGLLFSVCGMLGFVRCVERKAIAYALGGAALYLLALSCKEVFAPLPALLLFLPVGTLRERVRALLAFVPVALFYVVWRHAVLGEFLGSYHQGPGFTAEGVLEALRHLPDRLAGGGVVFLVVTGLALHAGLRRRSSLLLVLVAIVLLTFPLAPLRSRDEVRYYFVPWWGLSVGAAALLSVVEGRFAWKVRIGLGAVLVAAALASSIDERAALAEHAIEYEETAAFALEGNPEGALYSENSQVLSEARSLLQAANSLDGPRTRPRFVTSTDELASVDLAVARVYRYDERTRTIRDISAEVPELLERLRATEVERPLRYRIERRDDKLFWDLGPYKEGQYYFEAENTGRIPVPPRGSVRLEKVHSLGRIRYESPEGWVTIGPPLEYDALDFSVIEWARP